MHSIRALVLTSTLLLSAGTAASDGPAWFPGTGHFYEARVVPGGITWEEAKAACEATGGYLATITSSAENAFIFGLIQDPALWTSDDVYNNSYGPWIGGFQPAGAGEPDGGWQWLSGEPWGYTNWSNGEPNDFGNNEYAVSFFDPDGFMADQWNDLPGVTTIVHGYVCESHRAAVRWKSEPRNVETSFGELKRLFK